MSFQSPVQNGVSHRTAQLCGALCCAGVLAGAAPQEAIAREQRVQIAAVDTPVNLLSGRAHAIPVIVHNREPREKVLELRTRVLQASSSTAVTLSEASWKKLTVLPGQKVLEAAPVALPSVRGRTKFFLQCFEGTNLIGSIEVIAFPTNILSEVKPLVGGEGGLGVFDPANLLKPMLAAQGVPFKDLEQSGVADFKGRLAIIGPFQRRDQSPGDMPSRVKKAAERGAAIVWLRPPSAPGRVPLRLQPSFRTVIAGAGRIVIAQTGMVANLESSPEAQNNLISLCKVALGQDEPRLPEDSTDLE